MSSEVLVEKLSLEEEGQLATLVKKAVCLGQKIFGPDLFFSLIRLRPSLSSEVAILRQVDGQVEMYLIQRSEVDPFYPNQWHGPGCMLVNDELVQAGANRVMVREVGLDVTPMYAGKFFEWPTGTGSGQCPRGHTVCFYHIVWCHEDMASRVKGGKFFPIDALP